MRSQRRMAGRAQREGVGVILRVAIGAKARRANVHHGTRGSWRRKVPRGAQECGAAWSRRSDGRRNGHSVSLVLRLHKVGVVPVGRSREGKSTVSLFGNKVDERHGGRQNSRGGRRSRVLLCMRVRLGQGWVVCNLAGTAKIGCTVAVCAACSVVCYFCKFCKLCSFSRSSCRLAR